MKWGRKKISSSSRPSLISNVLPSSWVSKFKRMSLYTGQGSSKDDIKGKWDSVYMSPWRGPNEDRGEEDAFWRLSFREEIVDGKSEHGSVLRPVWYHNYVGNEAELTKPSSCQGNLSTREELVPKFSDMVSELREARGLAREAKISEGVEKVAEIRTPRLRLDRMKKTKNQKRGGKVAEQQSKVENACKMEAGRETSGNRDIKREDWNLAGLDGRDVMDSYSWNLAEEEKLKGLKIEEIKERKSLYIRRVEVAERRPKQKAIKVKSYSPRLASKAEPCKIKALEDMKKAKAKTRKKKERREIGFMGLESFALVKTSLDPHKDFHDSMMEMINERGISHPDELEELLACYLTLNSDEYHDLIIKVFRQVWFELNQACPVSELENEKL